MSVLQRKELEDSPLADLHAIASELGLDGFRSLRKAELISTILEAQGGEPEPSTPVEVETDAPPSDEGAQPAELEPAPEPEPEEDEPEPRREREREPAAEPEETIAGVLDILPNGSGFLRRDASGQSRDDVYVSPAQIRRCELRAGDEVSGPVRPPRRSERHPSLVRVESVNGNPAEPPEERAHFDDLTPVFPTEQLIALADLSRPAIGKGSRVAIGGPPGAGATHLLLEIARALAETDVELSVVLAGVRPEEVTDWSRALEAPVSGGGFDRSSDAQVQGAELAVERAKRAVERGRDAALVIDSLESLPQNAARRIFGAARNTEEGGSLTIVASVGMAWEPQRHATTRIVLDPPKDGVAQGISDARSSVLRGDLLN